MPAWYGASGNLIVLEGVTPRSTSGRVFSRVLASALFEELRQERGISYTATAEYWPRDATHATVTALADGSPENLQAVAYGVVDVLTRIRHGEVGERELASAKELSLKQLQAPDADVAMLPAQAVDALLGRRAFDLPTLIAEVNAVTVEDLSRVAEEVHDTALAQIPYGHELETAGFVAAPQWSEASVGGTEYRARARTAGRLVIGSQGASNIHPEGAVTVHFRDVAAMECFPDGGRRLHGRDGFMVRVEPTLHEVSEHAIAFLDAEVPIDRVIHQPPRTPEEIPRPQGGFATRWPALRTAGRTAEMVVFIVMGLCMAFFGVTTLITGVTQGSVALCLIGVLALVGWVDLLYEVRKRARKWHAQR